MPRPQRVAVTGVSHWHSTYDASYLRLLSELQMDIVGVSDENLGIAEDRAKRFGGTAYTDYRHMIEKTKPEFVVALGRHVDMPAVFRYLIDTGIPFMMEKPWGVDPATVNGLADLAESRKAWVAVPYMTRYSHWAETARDIVFRMIRPTMERYNVWDSPWMLSKAAAGGGALINLGSHGFDICRFITGEEPTVVGAVTSNAVHRSEVEDYAFATLRTPSGIIFHNEVGYTMPTWPKNSTDGERKVAAEKGLLRGVAEGVHILAPDRDEVIPTPKDYVGGYKRVILECLDRLERGEPPPITARDCARAVSLIHEAYRLAERTASAK
jgi:predicted dehydrogenase